MYNTYAYTCMMCMHVKQCHSIPEHLVKPKLVCKPAW